MNPITAAYDGPLYMLALDHRTSFQRDLFGIHGVPTAIQEEQISDTKRVVYDAFVQAIQDGVDRRTAGILVDEEFGAGIARRARAAEVVLAMPVEKSGQAEFDFEFGARFGSHIEEFDPTFAKALVRYNTEGDSALNGRQEARLKMLSVWLHERERKLLLELLVPVTTAQLDRVSGDVDQFDSEIRPELVVDAIRELQDAGVEADVWKIEGLDRREDCRRVSAQARAGGRDGVACIVLGRGADAARVEHWLKQAAGVPGYVGFAVGRTIWWDALSGYATGLLDGAEAARRIASNYRRMIDVYASQVVQT